jgi:hypothetical protein
MNEEKKEVILSEFEYRKFILLLNKAKDTTSLIDVIKYRKEIKKITRKCKKS